MEGERIDIFLLVVRDLDPHGLDFSLPYNSAAALEVGIEIEVFREFELSLGYVNVYDPVQAVDPYFLIFLDISDEVPSPVCQAEPVWTDFPYGW